MEHTPDQHVEHAQHAAHNPLDRMVAMSMAIIAALLAAAAMISHRGHTETLKLTTEANIKHTKSSDLWAFFQATNIRAHEYKALIPLLDVMQAPQDPDKEALRNKTIKDWRTKLQEYEGKKDKSHSAGTGHTTGEGADAEGKMKGGKLGVIQHQARQLEHEAEELEKDSQAVHHSVNWIDYGHLGLELAIVLASVTVLTKQRAFWYVGLTAAAAGVGLVLIGVSGLAQLGHF